MLKCFNENTSLTFEAGGSFRSACPTKSTSPSSLQQGTLKLDWYWHWKRKKTNVKRQKLKRTKTKTRVFSKVSSSIRFSDRLESGFWGTWLRSTWLAYTCIYVLRISHSDAHWSSAGESGPRNARLWARGSSQVKVFRQIYFLWNIQIFGEDNFS